VVALLNGFDVIHTTEAQSLLVTAEASSVLVLAMAITQHFRPGTAEEPVAVGVSVIAFATSTTGIMVGFNWFSLSQQQAGLLITLTTVLVAMFAGWGAREAVTAKITPPANMPEAP
jgi:hypothetical protein